MKTIMEEHAKFKTRIVRVHTGLRIRMDASNHLMSHVDPIVGAPYQQYQAMQRRL
jgi:hypothetical protein